MNNKLIVLVGISGAGKSTFAKQYIKDNPGTVRVNRDDMRRQILGELTQDYYSNKNNNIRGKLEKHITILQNEQIRHWLLNGFDVIADNTHLRKDDITNYERNFGYLADIYIKPIEVEPIVAKHRVILREGMGTDVQYIDRQIKEYNSLEIVKSEPDSSIGILFPKKQTPKVEYNPKLPDCYLIDIDGTCASCEGVRSPYDGEKLYLDNPIVPMQKLLAIITKEDVEGMMIPPTIIYVSGREDKWAEATMEWLGDHGFPTYHTFMYMRKTGDTRKDTIVKREIYEEYIKGEYNVLGIFDDRLSVTDTYREQMGLYVFNVNQKRLWF